MSVGLVAIKQGMTQVFAENGDTVPVTVLDVAACKVVALRTSDKDGYSAVQIGVGKAGKNISRAEQGHFAKCGQEPARSLREYRIASDEAYEIGQEIKAGLFESGQIVDVSGVSKGRGFAGVMKRWNFAGGRASHGAEKIHRSAGSTGQCQDPGRVFKGKKMAGHYGAKKITVQNLEVIKVDEENNRLLVKGPVPGPTGGEVVITPAVKGS